MKTKRQEIAEVEDLFNKTLIDKSYNEQKYSIISYIVKFIQSCTTEIKAEQLIQATFIVGPSGAGKSTLMNSLAQENNLIVEENKNLQLILKAVKSVTTIGSGEGSTTLFPTTWCPPNMKGIFLDCAGEGDTGGVIARAILALIKSIISQNVQQVKLLFVTSQSSLGQEAGYGKVFKESLDANAQFLNDIDYFKDSIAFVISHADRHPRTHNSVKNLIRNILVNHPNIDNYKNAITHVLKQEEQSDFSRVSTFSKPSETSEIGEQYDPPVWKDHPAQRDKIINMIEKLQFTKIPRKDFFKVSFDRDVQKQMQLALNIVKMKAGDLLANAINSNMSIFSVELKPFIKYLGELISANIVTDLKHYVKILKWNNYFKIGDISKEVEKLEDEMLFLSQFINETRSGQDYQKEHPVKENWFIKLKEANKKVSLNLDEMYDEGQKIINQGGNIFSKFEQKRTIKTISSSAHYSSNVQANLGILYNKYKQKSDMELKKNDQTSKYFKDEQKQEFDCNKKISFTETVQYVDIEYYQSLEEYTDIEQRTKSVLRTKPVTRYKTPEKIEPQFVEEDHYDMVPITKYRTETYTEQVKDGYRYQYFLWVTFNHQPTYKTVTKTREVPYTDYERQLVGKKKVFSHNKTIKDYNAAKIPYQITEEYSEEIIENVPIKKKRYVEKQRPITKEKQEQKEREEPVYKKLVIKVFNDKLYADDMKNIDQEIQNIRQLVKQEITKFKVAQGKCTKDIISSKDQFEQMYVDLVALWQDAEYGSYFAENPKNTLELLNLDSISKL